MTISKIKFRRSELHVLCVNLDELANHRLSQHQPQQQHASPLCKHTKALAALSPHIHDSPDLLDLKTFKVFFSVPGEMTYLLCSSPKITSPILWLIMMAVANTKYLRIMEKISGSHTVECRIIYTSRPPRIFQKRSLEHETVVSGEIFSLDAQFSITDVLEGYIGIRRLGLQFWSAMNFSYNVLIEIEVYCWKATQHGILVLKN